ncbi:protein phosphatase 1F isoform X2 [Etheostoma spectabile]|uniref:protein phosphatase 1F isoform X2 n=1 Tax=Etheostoma spectabile TaxID=54343 RepID=UPI0013AFA063|nr:protein phosphatase 1F isoform X2 [Etheostoma spectabile]
MEEEARCFLGRFVQEFPAALEEGSLLPVRPMSCKVSLEELHGECLELGLRLLAVRGAPAGLSALLCQTALSQLLQNDLLPFHCPNEADDNQEEEKQVVMLQSEAVQRLFLNKLIDGALAWHQNFPKLSPSPSRFLLCSVHAIKNTRRKMEDKHLALAEFNQLFGIQDGVECAYYALFDGHGGVDAATFAATHLHVSLSKQEALRSDTATAFKTAFKHTDDIFKSKAKRERLRSGTTAVAVLIQGQELTVAWLGDSQAMLVRKGQAVTLMDPHKPDREVTLTRSPMCLEMPTAQQPSCAGTRTMCCWRAMAFLMQSNLRRSLIWSWMHSICLVTPRAGQTLCWNSLRTLLD